MEIHTWDGGAGGFGHKASAGLRRFLGPWVLGQPFGVALARGGLVIVGLRSIRHHRRPPSGRAIVGADTVPIRSFSRPGFRISKVQLV
jgi:hypothetical protein